MLFGMHRSATTRGFGSSMKRVGCRMEWPAKPPCWTCFHLTRTRRRGSTMDSRKKRKVDTSTWSLETRTVLRTSTSCRCSVRGNMGGAWRKWWAKMTSRSRNMEEGSWSRIRSTLGMASVRYRFLPPSDLHPKSQPSVWLNSIHPDGLL